MALPIRVSRAIVGIVKETTAGTWVEPAGADSFHAANIVYTPSQEYFDREDTRAHFGLIDGSPGAADGDISFEIPMCGGGSLGTDPFWHTAMMACAHQRITAAGVSVTYKPSTIFDGSGTTTLQPSEGYSLAIWEDTGGNAPRYALAGCQGSLSIKAKSGGPLVGAFKFHGAYVAVADDTVPVVTDSALAPPQLMGVSVTMHVLTAPSLALDGFEFDQANVLSKRGDISNASGYRGAWKTKHRPTIKVAPEMLPVGSHDFFAKWRGGITGGFTTGVIGASAGNRLNFTAARTQYREAGLGEREGARTVPLTLLVTTPMAAVSGDDYSLVIT